MGPKTYESLDQHMKCVYFLLEKLSSEVLDDPLDRFTIIFNRLDTNESNKDHEWVKRIGSALAAQYPERMKKAYVLPVNMIFRSVWSVVKLFFDPYTASKISLLAGPQDLLKYISSDQLLAELGGTLDYPFDPNHLFTKEIPGVIAAQKSGRGAPDQCIYSMPSEFSTKVCEKETVG